MADTRDNDAIRISRSDRGDAALVAQYIHDLSERHGGAGPDALDLGDPEEGRPAG